MNSKSLRRKAIWRRSFRQVFNYLIKGALVTVPIAGALFLIIWIVASLDSALNFSSWFWTDEAGKPVYVPGLGLLMVLAMLILVGVFVTFFVTEPIKIWFNKVLNRIPLFSTLYSSIKDFTEAFMGDEKKFTEPVLVEINETGLKKIGFLTQHNLQSIGLEDEVMVYFPYAYSLSGQVCVVNKSRVTPLHMHATDAMKLAVSGGVTGLE
ncbi:Uncharacterized membrane protein [bacterium A37T11]|nr:Uncharacterized membrane protein [bacterium A37T11]